MFQFKLLKKDTSCGARLGRIHTTHGEVNTPVFMPVATQGTVKSLIPETVRDLGAEMILANTYHLYLRPGHESGGYQVYSLGAFREIKDDGVIFKSHIDGSMHFISPELAIEIQEVLGSDIMMCLDECTAYPASFQEAEKSLALTINWARRSKAAKKNHGQALFGIIQGGIYPELRLRKRC